MKLLEGKSAIVTGAARGIGKAIALKLAEYGANIAFTDLEYNDAAKDVEQELEKFGIKAKGYASDASNFEETQQVVDKIQKEFGSVDVLVNNAGIKVNLKSVFNFTKAAQKYMLKQKSGSIINMSSVVGVAGNAGQANYSASKAGIIGFTKSVAKEVGSRNIRCNAIAPGFIITEMTAKLPEDVRKDWEQKIPLRRGGTPEDVANSTLFLASKLSAYISGQVINVCGAMQT